MLTVSMQQGQEIIHFSIGSKACQVTAHWFHLQGLVATSNNDDNDDNDYTTPAACAVQVTHGIYQQHWVVPCVLMIDWL